MPYGHPYYVRVKVDLTGEYGNTYHAAMALARKLSRENAGLTFEVMEDKVWYTARAERGHYATEEVQE